MASLHELIDLYDQGRGPGGEIKAGVKAVEELLATPIQIGKGKQAHRWFMKSRWKQHPYEMRCGKSGTKEMLSRNDKLPRCRSCWGD